MPAVAAGVAASGLSAYVFLAVTARHFGPVRYAPLATFWSITFLIGPGCFATLEKETGRLISGGMVLEDRQGPVLRRAVLLGGCATALLVMVFMAGSPVAVGRLFNGNWVLMGAFLISLATICVQYLGLGLLAGNSRFGAYGVLAGAEGLLRLGGAAVLLAFGTFSLGAFGLVIAVAPALAVVCVIPALRASSSLGVDVGMKAMARSTSWLLVGTLLSTVLVGSGPITVQLLGGHRDPALTGRFLSGLVLVRVPLFLYNSASATLLPSLAVHAAAGDRLAFRRTLNRLVGLVAVVGAICTIVAGVAGPTLLGVVFGASYELPGPDMAILAGAAAALLVGTTLSVGLMACGQAARLALAWGFGVVVMVAVTAAVQPLLTRVEMGLLAGSVASAAAMIWPLYRRFTGLSREIVVAQTD
ncbi:MAG: hypothetical protein M3063_03485 [Actinomycetota bacterium]|nr:hypothetical protein [Actinomycetota bacterium]